MAELHRTEDRASGTAICFFAITVAIPRGYCASPLYINQMKQPRECLFMQDIPLVLVSLRSRPVQFVVTSQLQPDPGTSGHPGVLPSTGLPPPTTASCRGPQGRAVSYADPGRPR